MDFNRNALTAHLCDHSRVVLVLTGVVLIRARICWRSAMIYSGGVNSRNIQADVFC